jgi:hypothetical protein
LQVQQIFAELFHNAVALRGINHPGDVNNMPPAQKAIAIRSIQAAKQGLQLTLGAPAYGENFRYGGLKYFSTDHVAELLQLYIIRTLRRHLGRHF